jgi:hypothetical protein
LTTSSGVIGRLSAALAARSKHQEITNGRIRLMPVNITEGAGAARAGAWLIIGHVKQAGMAVLAAATLLFGCSRNLETAEAVREGVISHLAGRAGLDVGSMDVEVASVTFRGNEADATVSFRPKGSTDPASGMRMRYTLERQGSRWVVKSKGEAGGTPHGAGGALGGDPHGSSAAPPGGELPPGHPPLGEANPPAPKQ